ncbi:hypothetical protein DCAR_0414972 [Daucus carota subsp. sativus]|uniref:NAD(P)H dehydrogenase subunit H n=1 Tax=Daucus carota subsp. sativus TaxID=79200 RepID=A0AAF0WVI8_DAUCS|nr:hypothetical protein DCAR_0414972 [Daucus carota subsp. sativus]
MTAPATRNDLMIVNMGPQHPSMHGVLRLIVTLDGEDVIDCEPILGYLHRGMERAAVDVFLEFYADLSEIISLFCAIPHVK